MVKCLEDKEGRIWLYSDATFEKQEALKWIEEIRNTGFDAELVKRKKGFGIKIH